MTMPKMYIHNEEPEIEKKPMPLLMVSEKMEVLAMDEYGSALAYITAKAGYCRGALDALGVFGYDTSWAEWDKFGAFVKLKGE